MLTMRRSPIVGGLILTLITGCATSPRVEEPIIVDQMQSAAFYRYWQSRVPLAVGETIKNGYLIDDNLYVTTDQGTMFAIQADKGLVRWGARLSGPGFEIYRPSHLQTADGQGPLAVTTTSQLHILDRYSGEPLLSIELKVAPSSGAVGDGQRIFMGSVDGNFYSLTWNVPANIDPIERWRVLTGLTSATPVLDSADVLYIATEKGFVAACDADDKTGLWSYRTAGPIVADPFVDGSGVYVASSDRSTYRIDPLTGKAIWRYRFPNPLKQGPIVANFTCYQFCPGEGLTAIDIDDASKPKWQRADAVSLLTTRGGEAVIRTDAGMIEVVDNQTGETKRSFPAEDVTVSLGNRQGDALYLITADGRINCVRPEGIPYLRHQEIEAARAFLNRPPQQTADIPLLFNNKQKKKERADVFRSLFDRGGN